MIKKYTIIGFVSILILAFSGCLKDTQFVTYKLYTPIVEKMQTVLQQVKITTATAVKNAGKMVLLGNTIYLVENEKGVHIINNSNPKNPAVTGFIQIPGCVDIAIKGTTMYADCYTDLIAIDLSSNSATIANIQHDVFKNKRMSSWQLIADSGYAITGWNVKDSIVALKESESRSIAWIGGGFMASANVSVAAIGIGGSMARFTIVNNYLYTVSTSTLSSYNISNALQPKKEKQQTIGFDIETIYPFKNNLFIGGQTGMQIFDISTPNTPVFQSNFSHARVCDPVIADDNFAYVTLRSDVNVNTNNNALMMRCQGNFNELNVLDITNVRQPKLLKTTAMYNPHGLGKEGNILMICDGDNGVKVYNAANPINLQLLHTIALQGTYDVICHNNIAYISTNKGLYLYSYTNSGQIDLLSSIQKS
jgi:hypothetical protein